MLKSIKIIVREFKKKEGGTFIKASVGGAYLPIVIADENTNYDVHFTSDSVAKMPNKEGVYQVAYENNGLWLDARPEMASKNIVRIKATRVLFDKPLAPKEKPIEENK